MDYFIAHVGVAHDEDPPGRGSGRYAFGEGNRPHQHDWDIKSRIEKERASGMKDSEIAAGMGLYQTYPNGNIKYDKSGKPLGSSTRLKAVEQMAGNNKKKDEFDEVNWYYTHTNPDTGKAYTPTEIGRILGRNESSVRSIYNTGLKGNAYKTADTADKLKEVVDKKGMIDVGSGVEMSLGVSPDRLNTSLAMLQQQGYTVTTITPKQAGNSNREISIKVLAPPGTTATDIYKNRFDIKTYEDIDGVDNMATLKGAMHPKFIPLSKVDIVYDEQGGTKRDGEVMIRAVRDENGKLQAANPDLSLGNARYAQVRIAVDGGKEYGNKYIKGMAVYSEDVPDKYDILVNSNKSINKGVDKALKDMEIDPETGELSATPFGSAVVQQSRPDGSPSAINLVGTTQNDVHKEGEWAGWSKNLPSQFLAKQSLGLVTQQLKLKSKQSEDEFEEIKEYNNPIVKKKLLLDFADQCDADAVKLKAAPIGGQGVKVLMPIDSLKDTECYCPSLDSGTTVALVRFPHTGPFEIPVCKVNNSNKEGKAYLSDGRDCIGINQRVASRLSGADFDGDTVIAIPMTRKNAAGEFEKANDIKSAPALEGLVGFDTNEYSTDNPRFSSMVKKGKDGKMHPTYKVPTEDQKQMQMGIASNLITDMYAKGCEDPDELTRAVKYSMVIIDAKKHELNYEQAFKDFGIGELQTKYQKPGGGASSLLSRSKSPKEVEARQERYDIDPETGRKIWKAPQKTMEADRQKVKVAAPEGYVYVDSAGKSHKSKYMKGENGKDVYETSTGKIVKNKDGSYEYDPGSKPTDFTYVTKGYKKRTQDSTKMYEAETMEDIERDLMSPNPNEIEKAYAQYAMHMKTLGNEARKAYLEVEVPKKDPAAAKEYAEEVESLKEKLDTCKRNRPRERQANLVATAWINAAYKEHPDWDKDKKKKIKGQLLEQARKAVGANGKNSRVTFTEKEWEAINHNAISPNFLTQLLSQADKDNYTQLALPKKNRISDSKKASIKAMYNAGWSYSEIAKSVGVSTSSIANIVAE